MAMTNIRPISYFQFLNFLLVIEFKNSIQHFMNGEPKPRMHPVRFYFGQGHQNEEALAHQRMRHLEYGQIELDIFIEKKVKIQGPRTPFNRPDPSEALFHLEHEFEERLRLKPGLQNGGRIDKAVLLHRPYGAGSVERRNPQDINRRMFSQHVKSLPAYPDRVPLVTPDCDCCFFHRTADFPDRVLRFAQQPPECAPLER